MPSRRIDVTLRGRLFIAALVAAGTWPVHSHAQEPAPAATSRQNAQAPAAAPILYLIRYRPGPSYRHDRPLLQQDLRAHGAYMQDLTRRGVILAAGPTLTETGGLVLLRVTSIKEARAAMHADPAVRSGIFIGEVSDWQPFFDPGARFRSGSEPR